MSRLTGLLAQTKAKAPQLGADLEQGFKALLSRLAFGPNFERHVPESVELPSRLVRRGDNVRILRPRGSTEGGQTAEEGKKVNGTRLARLEALDTAEAEPVDVAVDDLVVVAEFRVTSTRGCESPKRRPSVHHLAIGQACCR